MKYLNTFRSLSGIQSSDSVSKACHLSQSKGLLRIDRALTGGCFQAARGAMRCYVGLWQFLLGTPLESLSALQLPASILSLLLPQEVAWAIHHSCYQVWLMETKQVDEPPGTCSLQQWCSLLTLCWEHSTPCFQGMSLMTSAVEEAGNVLLTHVNKLWAWTVGYTLLLASPGKFKVGDNTSKSPWPLYQVASCSSYVPLGGLRNFRKAMFSRNIIRIQKKKMLKLICRG